MSPSRNMLVSRTDVIGLTHVDARLRVRRGALAMRAGVPLRQRLRFLTLEASAAPSRDVIESASVEPDVREPNGCRPLHSRLAFERARKGTRDPTESRVTLGVRAGRHVVQNDASVQS